MAAALPSITTRSGVVLPQLTFGIGTALFAKDASSSIQTALSAGFRSLDCAEVYANAASMKTALASASVSRNELVITDKIGGGMKTSIRGTADKQLQSYGLDRFDVILLHYPPRGQDGNPTNVEAWKEMEKLKDAGIAKTIGVSNWLAQDIKEVVDSHPQHPIEVNQIEFNPYVYPDPKMRELLEVQQKHHIATMIYAPLVPITKPPSDAEKHRIDAFHSVLERVGSSRSLSPGSVLLKWASQIAHDGQSQDGVVITTSNKLERCKEYLGAFENKTKLSQQDLDEIAKAGQAVVGGRGHKVYMANYF